MYLFTRRCERNLMLFIDRRERKSFPIPLPDNGLTKANKRCGRCFNVDKHKFKFPYNSFAISSVSISSSKLFVFHRIEFDTST